MYNNMSHILVRNTNSNYSTKPQPSMGADPVVAAPLFFGSAHKDVPNCTLGAWNGELL